MGRRQELATAKRLLSETRLLTLTGPGGVGKTRLAARLAEQVARAYSDGVWLVPLAAVQESALVPHAVADALAVHDDSGRPPEEALREHLHRRRLLLVLDNCEHLRSACAILIGSVLAAAEGVQVLATSRHRLGLTEEHLLPVGPLRTPAPGTPPGGTAPLHFPALQLFADRATAVAPDFEITEENQAAVVRVCHRLDGLPLAIELAAVRMQALGIEQLDERLDDRYRLLTSGSPIAPPRHRTLRSAVDWSYDLCTSEEQRAWAGLSVFAGSFDLSAAETVCDGVGLGRWEVLDTVAGLVEKSVLAKEEAGGTARYRMLALLRQYGLERLTELGRAAVVRRRHRDHFLRLVETLERQWFGPDQPAIVARLRAEHDNVRAALDFCLVTPGESRIGRRLVAALWFCWAERGTWAEMRHWWRRLASCEDGKAIGAPTRAVWVAGVIWVILTRSAAVLAGTPSGQVLKPQELPAIDPLPVLVARDARGQRELCFHVLSRVEIACTLIFRGGPERALPLCEEALAVCEAYGEQWARSYVLCTLAMARGVLGDQNGAAQSARRCLRLTYVAHEPYAAGRALDLLAAIAVSRGEAERAAVLQGAVHRIRHATEHQPLTGALRVGQGRVGERQARTALGDRAYEQAHRRGQELSLPEAVEYALSDRPGAPQGQAVPGRADTGPSGRSAAGPPIVPAAASAAGLSRREWEVAGLVAQGMTNRQIAETLVISRRTAEGHVERILAKLAFASRSQVAAWVSEAERASGPGKRPERP
ncbi:LuxR C-terminal-related transcriptional regulator [Streptomyces sp. NPDC050315]|uniref:ATP-binding protein n=1 Tax=Streptomyces sp. NPDC050315 TaxID=3155039 RepID=UPI003434F3E0